MNVTFYMHDLGEKELASIAEVFKGPILTTGDTVARFEKALAEYLGVKYVATVSSCTAGLHLALAAYGIGPGDEVITTPMTFVATLQAIYYAGAKPVLVDVEPDTGNIDVAKLEAAITPRTKAIMPVHLYGLLTDMRAMREVADRHGLKIIEDAAHALEAKRDGVRVAQLGDATAFSFFATKSITSGEGGAVATNDETIYKKLKLLRSHGMDKTSADRHKEGYRHWDVSILGWKYNMGNIEAAILLPQLARIETNLKRRQELSDRYFSRLSDLAPLVRFPAARENSVHCRHLFTTWVPAEKRDVILANLHERGVSCVVNYRAVHLLEWFEKALGHQRGDFPNAERIGDETISLPLYPTMPEAHVDYVAATLREVVRK